MYKNVGTGVNFEKKRNLINELQEKKFSEEEILKIMSDKSIIHELEDENNDKMTLKFLTVRKKGERIKGMFCCFCNEELTNIGNSPYPFLKKENPTGGKYGCCDKCNMLFVGPVRRLVKYGISDNDWNEVLREIKTALAEIN